MDFDRVCAKCQIVVPGGFRGLQEHLKRPDHVSPFVCGQDGCFLQFTYRKNLYVHLRAHHSTAPQIPQIPVIPGVAANNDNEPGEADALFDVNIIPHRNVLDEQLDESDETEDVVPAPNLQQSAEVAVLELRSINYMTTTALQSVQDQSFKLMQQTAEHLKLKVQEFMASGGQHSQEDITNLLQNFTLQDPFSAIRTKAQQLDCFKKKYGLISSETKYLGEWFDTRLNPNTLQLEPTQRRRSFQYVSLIIILERVLSDPTLRNLILNEKASDDAYLRTFRDGSIFPTLPVELQNSIRIILYVDDVELLQALSPRAGHYKVTGFYFGIQNLPAELNALLTYIFVTALAFADDAKKQSVWEPFLTDLKKLERDGLEVTIDGTVFNFRVVLVALIGDTAAVHEIVGFKGAGSSCFCRSCYIKRREMWEDGMKLGEPRTPERHAADVQAAARSVASQKATGVQGPSKLDGLVLFESTSHAVFDVFHDLLQGICKMEVKLALRHYVCIKKYFTEEQLQSRIKFFDYGFPDLKNKPGSKMTAEYLRDISGYNLHQTGAQMWLLTRAFPFLFADLVPDDDKFMQLISLLNQIMTNVFSHAVTDNDIDNLETIIREHHEHFQEMFPANQQQPQETMNEETEEEIAEEEMFQDYYGVADEEIMQENETNEQENAEGPADEEIMQENETINEQENAEGPPPAKKKKKKPKVIRMINKHHHLLHYAWFIRRFGPLVFYWCMRYEAKHYFFKLAATVSHNFINVLKTLMDLLQMKMAAEKNRVSEKILIGKRGTRLVAVEECPHSQQLVAYGLNSLSNIFQVSHACYKGIDYRPGLFFVSELISSGNYPVFMQIKAVYVSEDKNNVYLLAQEWRTEWFEGKYNAYHVNPSLPAAPIVLRQPSDIPTPRLLAKWKRYDSNKIYLAPRTLA